MKVIITIWCIIFPAIVPAQHIGKPMLPDFGHSNLNQQTYQELKINQLPVQNGINNVPNPYNDIAKMQQHQREQSKLLSAGNQMIDKTLNDAKYKTARFLKETKVFNNALAGLEAMLDGRELLSVAKAYYILEDAYGDNYLSEKEFRTILDKSAKFIKDWLVQNGYSLSDNIALNTGIQKFMSQPLHINNNKSTSDKELKIQTTTHIPFVYDYADIAGEEDYRNFFVTKCLATGTGQCNSLPVVYMLLAEATGADAYLSLAPQHAFIKYKVDGNMQNYETTSNTYISDRWYEDNLFISAEAKRSRVYMDTLNKQQMVANCLVDLGMAYLRKYGVADGSFIKRTIYLARKYSGNKPNINTYFLYSSMVARLLDDAMQRNNVKTTAEIKKYPEVATLWYELQNNEEKIKQLGYRPLPKGRYEELMREHVAKDSLQKARINTKEKRNMFLNTN